MASVRNGTKAVSETGQIPRELLEAYQAAEEVLRESTEDGDSTSITGVFRTKKRAEGLDAAKEDDAPSAGSAPAPAAQ
jgi:hypothetical protein